MIPDIIAEFGQVFAFARARWARYAEQIHPELRGVAMMMLQTISRKGPVTATELGRLLDMDKAVVSRQMTKLRDLELVLAQNDESDRRVVLLTVSEHGLAALSELHRELADAYERRLEGWDPEDVAALVQLLHRFNAASHLPESDGPAARCARKAAAEEAQENDAEGGR